MLPDFSFCFIGSAISAFSAVKDLHLGFDFTNSVISVSSVAKDLYL